MKLLLILLLAFACSNPGSPDPVFHAPLLAKITHYKDLSAGEQDVHGFINSDQCDSLLFSALLAVARNEEIDLTAARADDGQWFRRPSKDCLATGASKSTISRDMLLGVILYGLHFKDADLIERLWDYGSDNGWSMGEGLFDRTQFTPAMIGLLAQVRYKLTGKEHLSMHFPQTYNTTPGYTTHLSLLKLTVRGKLGKLSAVERYVLDSIKTQNPTNPLAQALFAKHTGGEYVAAVTHLMLWPEDLPTNEDWCDEWKTQRAPNDKSRFPCDEPKTHSGGAFLFAAGILYNTI